MAELYYGNYVVIPYVADASADPDLTLHMLTNVATAPIGSGKRASAWATFRRTLEWNLTGEDGADCGRIEETLRVAQEAKKAACPYWHALNGAARISGRTVTLHHAPDPAFVTGQVIWWSAVDGSSYGLAIVDSAALKTMTLVAVPDAFAQDVLIAPVLLGYIDGEPSVKESDGESRQWTVTLTQSMGDLTGPLRSTGTEAATLGVSISGSLVEMSPNRASGEATVLGISISGSLVSMVVSGTAAEAVAMGVTLSGTLKIVAINTNTSDAAALGITLAGTLS